MQKCCDLQFAPEGDVIYKAFEEIVHSIMHHELERDGLWPKDECFHKLAKRLHDDIVKELNYEID